MDVKTLCLGILTLGDATGYEIRKQFEAGPFAHFYDASFGSIYPALGRLLKDGLVDVTEHAQAGKPDKKVYSLTPEGRAAFVAALAKAPNVDKMRSEVLIRFFFAEMMDPAQLEKVYDEYFGHFRGLADFLATLDDADVPAGRLLVRRMGRTFYTAIADYLETHRDEFLAAAQTARSVSEAAE